MASECPDPAEPPPDAPEARAPAPPSARKPRHAGGAAALTLGALGVVFGDIGTSPLYAMQAIFSGEESPVKATETHVFGIVSLVFWSVTVIVSLKYVTLVLRADNEGEGGIMALIALVGRRKHAKGVGLIALGVFGAALFYGDGMITPAISVLSAVEGIEVVDPGLQPAVVPIALGIVVVLFGLQRFGTGAVGKLFGPVMALWFVVLALTGIGGIVEHPAILGALSPHHAIAFFLDEPGVAFLSLGAVVLTVTGAEALYADMGHFGRGPISRAWFFAVFPALTLQYLGQGALIIGDPSTISGPFFQLAPGWAAIPLVVLATVAAVIASQAVISGAFSVTRQAMQLGLVPRLSFRHTSAEEVGQVYAPAVNWGIFVAVVALVVGFESSEKLSAAYGIAVTGTLAIDTVLFFVVVHTLWHRSRRLAIAGAAAFLTVDLSFFGANLPKVPHGGWFPIVVAVVLFTTLMTWRRGRELITIEREEEEGSLIDFVRSLDAADPPIQRVPGCAVFLHIGKRTTPLALRANVEHNHVLHESVVILTVEVERVPHVPVAERLVADELGADDDGISHLRARFGFQDTPDVPATLRMAAEQDLLERPVDVDGTSYFLSRMTIVPSAKPGMATWRKRLFALIARNASSAADYFRLPEDQVVTVGSRIEF